MTTLLDNVFYAPGTLAIKRAIAQGVREGLRPPPILKISEWSAQFGQLSSETSASAGDFEAFPYQNGMLDAMCDPTVKTVSVMKSARVGFTKCLDLIIGYYIDQDPSPILVVQPRVEDAEDYSKTEIMPMIRDTPRLAAIMGDPKAKDSNQTILKKSFTNGSSLSLVGANAPGGFRRITVRITLFDEIDGYPLEGAGNEGDQIKLGEKRSLTFWNCRSMRGSTPTIKDFSRIEREFNNSDQRYFMVPCPHCGERQKLEWGGPDAPYGFKWDVDPETGLGKAETVFYVCAVNHCVIRETDKRKMVEKGEWVAHKPSHHHAGFHIWTAYSFFPNACWENIVREWLDCRHDPLARQVFFNTVLGLPYDDEGGASVSAAALRERGQDWGALVPNGVKWITCGVDVQDYRIEAEVIAWSDQEESWSLDYHVIEGKFSDPQTRAQLDSFLQKRFSNRESQTFPIAATCIDSGGHHTQSVYEFCKNRLGRRIYAIKGEAAQGGRRSPVWPTARPVKRKKKAFKPVIIGVNAAKDVIRSRLLIEKPGPGYTHFPKGRPEEYYDQLTAERSVAKAVHGFRFRIWELLPGRANEALDCRVYGYAALCSLKQFGFKIGETAPPQPQQHAAGPAPLAEQWVPGRRIDPMPPAVPEKKVSVTVQQGLQQGPSAGGLARLTRKLA